MDFKFPNDDPVIERAVTLQERTLSGGSSEGGVKILKPVKTRSTLSLFEYSGIITKLARYLAGIPDISKFLDQPYVNSVINPCELAFNLLESGKFDAVIDRGYERVNYSQLVINEKWKNSIREYFKEKNDALHEELIIPFGLG